METTNSKYIMYYDAEQKQFVTVTVESGETEQNDTEGTESRAECVRDRVHHAFV